MKKIIKGTVLSYPQMMGAQLRFFLRFGAETITVVRKERQAQKKDMVFLCPGQVVILRGEWETGYIVAEKIRILTGQNRK